VLDSLPRSFTLALGATLAVTAIVVIPSSLGAQQAADAPAPAAAPAAAPAGKMPAAAPAGTHTQASAESAKGGNS